MNMQPCSHGAVRRHERILAKQSERPTGAWLQQACIVRGIFVLLTLALALCVAPFRQDNEHTANPAREL